MNIKFFFLHLLICKDLFYKTDMKANITKIIRGDGVGNKMKISPTSILIKNKENIFLKIICKFFTV